MAKLRVDTDSMQKLDTNMQSHISEAADLMKQMRDSVAELDASWEGTNHDSFKESFASRKEAVKGAALTIEAFSQSFTQAVRLYMELEAEVAETVSKL